MKISLDFTDKNKRNKIKENINDMVNTLAGMRNLIIGIHINEIDSWSTSSQIYYSTDRQRFINTMDYPTVSTFMAGLTTILQDSRSRYLIPNAVKNPDKLEILIDTLYRAGCCFESGETKDEK